jgi:hypothetical protein
MLELRINMLAVNEDGEGIKAIIDMLGVMILSTFEMLAEHNLFKPDSEIRNIPIICLMLLDFVENEASDCERLWGCEIVRACDEAGIELERHVRKQVAASQVLLQGLREAYIEKKTSCEYALEVDAGNGYKTFARMADWTPDDMGDDDGERMWYRWDWRLEVSRWRSILRITADDAYSIKFLK